MQHDTGRRLQEKIRRIPRELKVDSRGWLLKVLNGREEDLPSQPGEVYLTLALPGHSRGNHLHARTDEWFTVLQGMAKVALQDQATGERLDLTLAAEKPETLYVPAGVAHVFTNPSDAKTPLLIVAYASRPYDPTDVFASQLL